MTNGEKIIEIVGKKPFIDTFSNPYMLFNKDWWNAEYKELTAKNDSKFCPDRKAKTTHAESFLHCIKNDCAAYKDGRCLKYNSKQEPIIKNNLAVDCINRQGAINAIGRLHPIDTDYDCTLLDKDDVMYVLNHMPSVTPQPRKGHWMDCSNGWMCSVCNRDNRKETNFCPNCGADMRKVKE